MSRKTDEKSNKGKEYTEEECNFIAFCLIWGICSVDRMANRLGRNTGNAILRMFDRICKDGSDYPDMRGEYKLWPIISSVKLKTINYYGWEFIKEQHIERGKSLESISERTGLDIEKVKEAIENKTGKKTNKDGLL